MVYCDHAFYDQFVMNLDEAPITWHIELNEYDNLDELGYDDKQANKREQMFILKCVHYKIFCVCGIFSWYPRTFTRVLFLVFTKYIDLRPL